MIKLRFRGHKDTEYLAGSKILLFTHYWLEISPIHLFLRKHYWPMTYQYVFREWYRTVVLGKTLESPVDCKEIKPVSPKGNLPWIFIRTSNTLLTWCEESTHWKRPWCWERLRAGGEGDNRGGDGWMASLTQWTWVWVNSGSWWWTGRPGVLWFMGLQGVGHDWATELNWYLFIWDMYI